MFATTALSSAVLRVQIPSREPMRRCRWRASMAGSRPGWRWTPSRFPSIVAVLVVTVNWGVLMGANADATLAALAGDSGIYRQMRYLLNTAVLPANSLLP